AKDEASRNTPQEWSPSPPASGGRGQGEGDGSQRGTDSMSVPRKPIAGAAGVEKPASVEPSPPTPLTQAGEGSRGVRKPGHKPIAAPAVRQRARDLGIDLRL